jgi:hypothetical protein
MRLRTAVFSLTAAHVFALNLLTAERDPALVRQPCADLDVPYTNTITTTMRARARHTHGHTHTHTHIHGTHIYIHIHTHSHTYTHAHTHTYTHTQRERERETLMYLTHNTKSVKTTTCQLKKYHPKNTIILLCIFGIGFCCFWIQLHIPVSVFVPLWPDRLHRTDTSARTESTPCISVS